MAALMQSPSEANPLPAAASGGTPSSADSLLFLRNQSEPNLSSIASAGLHVSKLSPRMGTARIPDRDHQQQQQSDHDRQLVAREALGAANERSHSGDPMHVLSDQMKDDEPQTDLVNTVASPGPIEEPDHPNDGDEPGSRSFTYPLPTTASSTTTAEDPRRGLSLPYSRSPSAKKHRCPYCPTEFTRQHNLKSHLLTHSQEKPYVCSTCQLRFRRSHDLKRHAKLHTGERPHICDKCGRRFARGDALARHNKGQGGCAGRRTSMGSFAADDDYGDGGTVQAAGTTDEAMDGLVYAEPERMDEDEERQLGMPGIRAHDASSISSSNFHRTSTTTSSSIYQPRQPNTYPPVAAGRPSPGGLLPPTSSRAGSSTLASPVSPSGNMTFPPAGQSSMTSIFPPSVTGSPRALSPNPQAHQFGNLARSPQPQQQSSSSSSSFSRSNTLAPQTSIGLPPPQPVAPQLPPPPGLSSSSSDPRLLALPKQGHSLPRTPTLESSQPNQEEDVWPYIRSILAEMAGLRAEIHALRAQLASKTTSSHAER